MKGISCAMIKGENRQKGWKVPMLSRQNDLGIFKKQRQVCLELRQPEGSLLCSEVEKASMAQMS